jgi:hypothetical protein
VLCNSPQPDASALMEAREGFRQMVETRFECGAYPDAVDDSGGEV